MIKTNFALFNLIFFAACQTSDCTNKLKNFQLGVTRDKIRGFFIACKHERKNIYKLQQQISGNHGLEIKPLLFKCNNTKKSWRKHVVNVHNSHVRALKMCSKFQWSPCAILESDASWDGDLYMSLSNAIRENSKKKWDLIVSGISPVALNNLADRNRWPSWPPQNHSMRIPGTAGGCHAYVVRNPNFMSNFLKKRNVMFRIPRGNWFYTPCIEHLVSQNLFIVLATDLPVVQDDKDKLEGLHWKIENGKIIPLWKNYWNSWNFF